MIPRTGAKFLGAEESNHGFDKEIKLLAAETLAIQTVLGYVFQEVAMVDSRIAAAMRRGFEKLMPSSSRRSGNAQIALLSRNRPVPKSFR